MESWFRMEILYSVQVAVSGWVVRTAHKLLWAIGALTIQSKPRAIGRRNSYCESADGFSRVEKTRECVTMANRTICYLCVDGKDIWG